MDLKVWYAEQLLGAAPTAVGKTTAKMIVGESLQRTASLRVDAAGDATVQVAHRQGVVAEVQSVGPAGPWAAVLGSVARTLAAAGFVPAAGHANQTQPPPPVVLSPVEVAAFAAAYAEGATQRQVRVEMAHGRAAALFFVGSGVVWLDMLPEAFVATSTEAETPNRTPYPPRVLLYGPPYKWTGNRHATLAVQACKLVTSQAFKIIRSPQGGSFASRSRRPAEPWPEWCSSA